MSGGLRWSARAALPDIPRWVETRALLAYEDCPVFAQSGDVERGAFAVCDLDDGLASVVGQPLPQVLRQCAAGAREILAFPENIEHVVAFLPPSEWRAETVAVHSLPPAWIAPAIEHPTEVLEVHTAELVSAAEEAVAGGHIPRELTEELLEVLDDERPLAVAYDDGLPVAFAYPSAVSETLWDMSIDTVPSRRRRGFAQAAACRMIHHMKFEYPGNPRAAVWCSAASNEASARLARKIGFVAVDQIWLLTRVAPVASTQETSS